MRKLLCPNVAALHPLLPSSHDLHVCLADNDAAELKIVEKLVADIVGPENVLSVVTDVSKLDQVEHLRDEVMAKFGEARMNGYKGLRWSCHSDLRRP